MRSKQEIEQKLEQLSVQPTQENFHDQSHRLRAVDALNWVLGLEENLE